MDNKIIGNPIFVGGEGVNSLQAKTSQLSDNGQSYSGTNLDLNSTGYLSGYGGYIDFHYNGSTADYTSRIIEKSQGQLSIDADKGFVVNSREVRGRPWNSVVGQAGVAGYVGFAKITITSVYANSPFEFIISQRRIQDVTRLVLEFSSVNSLEPELSTFIYHSGYTHDNYHALKTGTSTWELYALKMENYDYIDVIDVLTGQYVNQHITIEPINILRTTAPTWTKTATKVSY